MNGVRMVNLNNHIYLFGGYDDILQYKDGAWNNVGNMNTGRSDHAVSVANYKDVCK